MPAMSRPLATVTLLAAVFAAVVATGGSTSSSLASLQSSSSSVTGVWAAEMNDNNDMDFMEEYEYGDEYEDNDNNQSSRRALRRGKKRPRRCPGGCPHGYVCTNNRQCVEHCDTAGCGPGRACGSSGLCLDCSN